MMIHARAALRRHQQQELTRWARSLMAKVEARPVLQRSRAVNIETDLAVAASDLSSMRQAGLGYGPGTVIAIMSVGQVAARLTPTALSDLQGSTVVVDDFPGSTDEQAAWQASLVQGGAARAVMLTPGMDDQVVSVVREGLDGAITDTLTSVLFGLGQYKLRAAAVPQLRKLLYLLTVKYPQATVAIDGYTDNLPVPAATFSCPGSVRGKSSSGLSHTESPLAGCRPSAMATATRGCPILPTASRLIGALSSLSTRQCPSSRVTPR
jgi:outer membrane protein OmpA-like peptidoglycan-associated protein